MLDLSGHVDWNEEYMEVYLGLRSRWILLLHMV